MSGRRKKQRFAAEERRRRRQFTFDERKRALEALVAGQMPGQIADGLGCSRETLRLWKKAAEADGTMPEATQPTPVATRKDDARRRQVEPAAGGNGGPVTAGGE